MDDAEIGRRIYDLRVERDVQQGELAAAIHLNQSVLNRIEKGVRPARALELRAIALYFRVTVDDLLGIPPARGSLRLTPTERRLLEKFRALDARGRSAARRTIESEYDFLQEEESEAQKKDA